MCLQGYITNDYSIIIHPSKHMLGVCLVHLKSLLPTISHKRNIKTYVSFTYCPFISSINSSLTIDMKLIHFLLDKTPTITFIIIIFTYCMKKKSS